ncbi:MAG: DUF2271 domain-containing protein [Bacteroidales bacterium]|nr:DUF2271 domain-containing protein [Bacteroidales bacterium]
MSLNIIFVAALLLSATSCEKEELNYSTGDIRINIETGGSWLKDHPLFLGISKKSPPQFAIWLEDTSGNYLSTIFVTSKTATEGWIANKGNRRKESLPHWCHKRGVVYDDGLFLPTKEKPLSDGVTGATPKVDKEIQISIKDFTEPVIIKAEFNHSIDFNDFFPENAVEGHDNYSGGKMGSGQPAIIYADTIYPNQQSTYLKLTGRSSADGSDGMVYSDLEKLTTAKRIVKQISVKILK